MSKPFQLNQVTTAVTLALAGLMPVQHAWAGPGFADITKQDGTAGRIQTYFAYSPSGDRITPVPEGALLGVPNSTGVALRKFVDPLPLPGEANAKPLAGDATVMKYIPVATPQKWVNPQGKLTNDDYYELALVEYSEKFHSDLKKATVLRGYVQLSTAKVPGKAIPLTYPDGTPIMVGEVDANGKLTGNKVQAKAVDNPHYLGPIIQATRDVPTRLKFLNLLPTGRAQTTAGPSVNAIDPATGAVVTKPSVVVTKRNGDIFLPLDRSILGSGFGPDGMTEYTQNRVNIHLHGGDTPWISDGTPHQWTTPVGEADPSNPLSLAALFADGAHDPALLPNFLRGASAVNVPDMNDPGPGGMTFYYPNGQTARIMWYHDHTIGQTRLNVYAGMASAYLLTDSSEQSMITDGTLPPPERTIPLVLQDRTFVPDDIALQDAHWNTSAWGAPGDSWFPHVYETVQDPAQINNWNAVGRWHYGPWFWPVFPALYSLPSGEYGDVTTTPEAWMDTPIINGTAYPTMEVDPTTYRFRILNAANDRVMTFNLFKAVTTATLADGSIVTSPLGDTEINMIPASTPAHPCINGETRPTKINGILCTPAIWPTDARLGGVPRPEDVGPALYQIANEGGWLPKVATIEPSPIHYIQDKGRITVLNADPTSLFLAPAERADVVVDFSQYAGQTLLVYNDSGAPVPAGDPRNDIFTGVGDQSGSGGAEDTQAGFGPNTRTMMQIKVRAAMSNGSAVPAAFDPTNLQTKVQAAYVATQDRPTVAQADYAAFDPAWASMTAPQQYANIYTGTLKDPTFKFTPGTPSAAFNSIQVMAQGSGYVTSPQVTITPGNGKGTGATAVATMKIDSIVVDNAGSGYTSAPVVSIVALAGGGSGAQAQVLLAPDAVKVTAGGTGYATAPTVVFTAPPTGGTKPVATATVVNGAVTGITVTSKGSGYTAAPLVSFTGGGGTGAKATASASIDRFIVTAPDATVPGTAGGGGYTNMGQVNITLTGGNGTGARAHALGKVFDITLTNNGTGYDAPPTVTLSAPPAGTTATAQVDTLVAANNGKAVGSILMKNKTIQELFDPTFGRLNATLGVELPFTSALTQTTIPLGYADEPTENFADGETQIWKITHNGVDTHPVHFHLMNVQLINRVGWDGYITPPTPNELGWKETLKLSPLEDSIVAVKAKSPKLGGFGVPLSVRAMDPTQPLGSPFGFTQIDPNSGTPKTVVNDIVNFGWEYVWHCHILGHEENDFMRPVIFNANEPVPTAPTLNSAVDAGTSVSLSYTDLSSSEYKFSIRRAPVSANGTVGIFTEVGTELANSNSAVDTSIVANTLYAYKVAAVGGYGEAESNVVIMDNSGLAPFAPSNFASVAASDTTVNLSWVDNSNNEQGFLVERSLDGGATWTALGTTTAIANSTFVYNVAGNQQSYSDTGLSTNQSASYRLSAVNAVGQSTPFQTTSVVTLGAPALASISSTADSDTAITVNWTLPATVPANQTISGFSITRTGGGATATFTAPANATSFADTGLTQNTAYTYSVQSVNAQNSAVKGTASTTSNTTQFTQPTAVTGFTAMPNTGTQVTLNWAGGTPAQSYTVTRTTAGTPAVAAATFTVNAPATSFVDTTATAGRSITYTVTANNGAKKSATVSATVTTPTSLSAPTIQAATVAANSISVRWIDNSSTEATFLVERQTNGGAWVAISTVTANRTGTGATLTLANTNTAPAGFTIAAGNVYTYRVSAQVRAGNTTTGAVTAQSVPSATVTVDYSVPVATANMSLTRIQRVTGTANDRVDLSWTAVAAKANQPAITGYTIDWSTTSAFTTVTGSTTAANTATTASLTTVARGTATTPNPKAYYFRIRANNAAGSGAAFIIGPVNTL